MLVSRLAALTAALVACAICATPARAAAAPGSGDDVPIAPYLQTKIRAAVARDLAVYGGKTPVPGVLLGVWVPGFGSMVEGIGAGRLEPRRPLSLADHVRVGSNTKTFVVTVLLQLVDEGKLRLDDPISAFELPVRVSGGGKITVRQLMRMQSGIVDLYSLKAFQSANISPDVPVDRVKYVQEACDAPRLFTPGTKWNYSNTNYMLLGMIAEAVSHDTIAHLIATRITGPLHLAQTTFPLTSPDLPAPYAHGYTRTKSGGWIDQSVLFPPSLTWAAGVMVSDVADMKRWVRAYVTGTTNSAATQRARLTCVPTGDPGLAFGLGIGCSAGWYGYTGGVSGYNTAAYYLPKRHATIIAFVTSQQEDPLPGVANAIVRDVAKIATPSNVPYVAVTEAAKAVTPCARTTIAAIRPPAGPAAYQSGLMTLANGATLRIEGRASDPGVRQALAMKPGDAVAACYGRAVEYADAGPSRAVTVLDLHTNGSYGNLVGTWPARE